MKILITGGCGFVGSNIAISLKRDNPDFKIICFDNLKRRGSELNIERIRESGIQFVHGDVRNAEDINSVGEINLLIDCSAEPSVLAGVNESPLYLINTNLIGTINCLELVRKYQASIIFLSTSRVYPVHGINKIKFDETDTRFVFPKNLQIIGISNNGINEEFSLNGARTLYGASKLASELLIQEYTETYGIRSIINRCGVIAGPWQFGKIDQGVVVLWMARHFWKGSLEYIGYGGSGKQVRDVLHIHDLANLINIQIKEFNKISGMTFNVGGGNFSSLSLLELTTICENITGNHIHINASKESRPGDIPYFITDNSKVEATLNWQPQKSPEVLLQDIYNWIKSNELLLKKTLG